MTVNTHVFGPLLPLKFRVKRAEQDFLLGFDIAEMKFLYILTNKNSTYLTKKYIMNLWRFHKTEYL